MSYIGRIMEVAKRNVMSNIGRHMMSYYRIFIVMARIRKNIIKTKRFRILKSISEKIPKIYFDDL